MFFSFNSFSQRNASEILCDSEYTQKSITSPWKKTKIEISDKGDVDGYCTTVQCSTRGKDLKRTKCFYPSEYENVINVTYQDGILEQGSFKSRGSYQEVRLHEGEECLSACTPVIEKRSFGREKKQIGLERESCRTCFMNREDKKIDDSYFYAAIGKKLYPGQWCSVHCLEPMGAINATNSPNLECQKCVGLNGHPGERFKYLLDNTRCFEVNSNNQKRVVPLSLCVPSESLITTTYQHKRTGNILFGYSERCEEIDTQTQGELFRKNVALSLCQTEAVDDSDRSIRPSREPEEKNSSRSKTRSTKQ